jgi:hypothetical protein
MVERVFVMRDDGGYTCLSDPENLDGEAYVLCGMRNGKFVRRVLIDSDFFKEFCEWVSGMGERTYLTMWSSKIEETFGYDPGFRFLKNGELKF